MLPCRTSRRSALRMCISSRSMGQILLPQGRGSFLGPHIQRWSKAAAVTLHITSISSLWAGTEVPACRHLPAAPCCRHHPSVGHTEGVQLCPAVTQHRLVLPLVWTPMQFPWEIRHPLPADCPSTGTEPCRAAKLILWLFLSLATDRNNWYPMCTGWWQRKEPLQQQPRETGMRCLT